MTQSQPATCQELCTPGSSPERAPGELSVIAHQTGQYEVFDQLYGEPLMLGAGALGSQPLDEFVVQSLTINGLGSVRQLSNIEQFSTKPNTARWSRAQHQLGAAMMASYFGGSRDEVLYMAVHDMAHRVGSHKVDDLLQGRGLEDQHDLDRARVLRATGLQELAAELWRSNAPCLAEFEPAHGFTNWPSRSGLLEVDRLEYILRESMQWVVTEQEALALFDSVKRVPESKHGDVLAVNDAEAATRLSMLQTRLFSEHWSEPVNDLIDELHNTALRYVLVKRTGPLSEHHPGDELFITEEHLQELFDQEVAEDSEGFIATILQLAVDVAEHQRDYHGQLGDYDYQGPRVPDWVNLDLLAVVDDSHQQRMIVHSRGQKIAVDEVVVDMEPGKSRFIDPLVITAHGLKRLSTLQTGAKQY